MSFLELEKNSRKERKWDGRRLSAPHLQHSRGWALIQDQGLSNLHESQLPGGLLKHRSLGPRVSDSVDLGSSPGICICNLFPDDTKATGLGTTLWRPPLLKDEEQLELVRGTVRTGKTRNSRAECDQRLASGSVQAPPHANFTYNLRSETPRPTKARLSQWERKWRRSEL